MKIRDITGQKHDVSKKSLVIVIAVLILLLTVVAIVGGFISSHGKSILSGIVPKLIKYETTSSGIADE